MKDIFRYTDFRTFIKDRNAELPNQGRGVLAAMAKYLGVHSTLMSLILAGKRELAPEQALLLAEFLELNPWQTEYFMILVSFARAGTDQLQKFYRKKIRHLQSENRKLDHHLDSQRILTEVEQAQFYSSWIYSAVRLQCSIAENGLTLLEISKIFNWPEEKIFAVVSFLEEAGLLKQREARFMIGDKQTFLSSRSPLVGKHHKNWRLRAIERSDLLQDQELMITVPCTMSRGDFLSLREQLVTMVSKASTMINDSNPEELVCLNVDLFKVGTQQIKFEEDNKGGRS